MKIALVSPYDMLGRPGGVQQLVTHLHAGLTRKGHEVKIITPRPPGFKGAIPLHYLILGATTNWRAGWGAAGNFGVPTDGGEIEAALKKEKFDLINFHEPWVPMIGWQILNYSDCAHVGTFHGNFSDNMAVTPWKIFTPYARGITHRMQILTAVSPAPVILLKKSARSEADRKLLANLRYIPCGVDLSLYKPYKKRLPLNGPETKTIVYVGRLDKRKGVEWLLRAFALVSKKMPNAYLIIAGDGNQSKRLEQIARTLKLKNVRFVGYVDEEEKRRLLGNADAACFPSAFGESFGIVLIEAMAMGTPLLGGNNIGYQNVMTGTGRIGMVDPEATKDFANRLEVFLEDKDIQQTARNWGLREVKQYDYPKIVDQYEAVYKEAFTMWQEATGRGTIKKSNVKTVQKIVNSLPFRRRTG